VHATGHLLILKLLLAPTLVAVVSVVTAKLGPRIGGIVGAFPMVSGPVLLLFALEQGAVFTTEAAFRTLVGTLSLVLYCAVYARVAMALRGPTSPWVALLAGYGTFFAFTLLLERLPLANVLTLPFAIASVFLGQWLVQQRSSLPPRGKEPLERPRLRYLALRMATAALLVYTLSETARALGPAYSGLLTPFPVASTVLLVATHLESGIDAMLGWLRGFIAGLYGYVTFVALIAYLLSPTGIFVSFGLALVGAFAVQRIVTKNGTGPSPR
jgi:hypothetical protein